MLTRDAGKWWAAFANYSDRGGVKGQGSHETLLAELDDDFRVLRRFTFPENVLARIAARRISGASWGADGRLYGSGHDKPEIYVLDLPRSGSVLRHAGTFAVACFGPAADFDPGDPRLLWSLDRDSGQ